MPFGEIQTTSALTRIIKDNKSLYVPRGTIILSISIANEANVVVQAYPISHESLGVSFVRLVL
jgi:hypothetical protein